MIARQAILAAARSYLGVRYHHQGRNRAGLDCAGLIVRVALDVGIELRDLGNYGRSPLGQALREHVASQAQRVATAQPGDVLLLRFEREPQHLAIATDRGMIHSYLAARQVVEHRIDAVWQARIVAAFALPGVEP